MAPVLKRVYDADGIADAVNFKLTAAIRGPEYTGSGFKCFDEDSCDQEVYFICARETVGANVHCLAAMSECSGSAKEKAQACAEAEGADFSKIEACFNSDQADTLKAAEAKYYDTRFPKSVEALLPTIDINGKEQGPDSLDYYSLISALCNTGISAGVCSKSIQV